MKLPQVQRSVLVALALLTGACDADFGQNQNSVAPPRRANISSCAAMPADFQSLLGYTKDRPIPITGYSGNVIKISSSGAIYWNEVELTGRHGPYPILEPYLAVTAEMNPAPLTYLDFDRGAPCSVIDNVRAMMRERLACGQGGVCLQGNAKF